MDIKYKEGKPRSKLDMSLVYLPSGGNLPTLHSHHGNLNSETPVFHGVNMTITFYSFRLDKRLHLKARIKKHSRFKYFRQSNTAILTDLSKRRLTKWINYIQQTCLKFISDVCVSKNIHFLFFSLQLFSLRPMI